MQKAVEKERQMEKQRQAQFKLQQQQKQMQLEQHQQKQEKQQKKKQVREHHAGNEEPTGDAAQSEDEYERTDSVNKNASGKGTDMSKHSNKDQSIYKNSAFISFSNSGSLLLQFPIKSLINEQNSKNRKSPNASRILAKSKLYFLFNFFKFTLNVVLNVCF